MVGQAVDSAHTGGLRGIRSIGDTGADGRGRGLTWRSGHIVVRPTDDPEEAIWKSLPGSFGVRARL